MITLVPIASVEPADVEHLLDLAFGPDRRSKTAYKLRDGVQPVAELSLAAVEDGALVGTIQCWPVQLSEADGAVTPLILVGPVAVHPVRQRDGIGRKLTGAALAQADAGGADPMMLIGDAVYYERFFGFSADHTQGWVLPGPVDRDRLLARLRPGQHLPGQAVLGPRLSTSLHPTDQALVPGGD